MIELSDLLTPKICKETKITCKTEERQECYDFYTIEIVLKKTKYLFERV